MKSPQRLAILLVLIATALVSQVHCAPISSVELDALGHYVAFHVGRAYRTAKKSVRTKPGLSPEMPPEEDLAATIKRISDKIIAEMAADSAAGTDSHPSGSRFAVTKGTDGKMTMTYDGKARGNPNAEPASSSGGGPSEGSPAVPKNGGSASDNPPTIGAGNTTPHLPTELDSKSSPPPGLGPGAASDPAKLGEVAAELDI